MIGLLRYKEEAQSTCFLYKVDHKDIHLGEISLMSVMITLLNMAMQRSNVMITLLVTHLMLYKVIVL